MRVEDNIIQDCLCILAAIPFSGQCMAHFMHSNSADKQENKKSREEQHEFEVENCRNILHRLVFRLGDDFD